jgi:predicted aminopeptidase
LRFIRSLAASLLLALASGCSTLGYYGHVVHGQASLLAHRKSIDAIVSDKSTDPKLRDRLAVAEAARRFASDRLGLPRNKSYTTYVDLGRPYATWNVFATREFSVDPVTHCFPFAGCVAYVGFFDKDSAERERKKLAEQGNDTAIEGAAAYSTLGWFADPLLSSMLRWNDDELEGMIFHELAHQLIYVEDDTAFNESFATFVQREGLREWRASRGLPPASDANANARDDAFTSLVLDLRERLRALYVRELDAPAMRAAKAHEIDAFRERYRQLRAGKWNNDAAYDRWVGAPINNARLVPFGLYDHWVPAFERLFLLANRDWPTFYGYVRGLAHLRAEARRRELDAWLAE